MTLAVGAKSGSSGGGENTSATSGSRRPRAPRAARAKVAYEATRSRNDVRPSRHGVTPATLTLPRTCASYVPQITVTSHDRAASPSATDATIAAFAWGAGG